MLAFSYGSTYMFSFQAVFSERFVEWPVLVFWSQILSYLRIWMIVLFSSLCVDCSFQMLSVAFGRGSPQLECWCLLVLPLQGGQSGHAAGACLLWTTLTVWSLWVLDIISFELLKLVRIARKTLLDLLRVWAGPLLVWPSMGLDRGRRFSTVRR